MDGSWTGQGRFQQHHHLIVLCITSEKGLRDCEVHSLRRSSEKPAHRVLHLSRVVRQVSEPGNFVYEFVRQRGAGRQVTRWRDGEEE